MRDVITTAGGEPSPKTPPMGRPFRRTQAQINNAIMEILTDEFEQLYALSCSLTSRLAPSTIDPESCPDINSWRLAQLIEERLETNEILQMIKETLAESE